MKTLLLVAAGLLVGNVSVTANDSFGSLDAGWWTSFSQTYTLEGYGKYHFQFTTTNANDGKVHKTWLLVATNGADSHGSGGTEYFAWRGDSYAWGQNKNSNPYDETNNAAGDPTHLVCSNTYATANPTGAGLQAAMNNATVDMIVTRTSTNIYAEATVTPTLAGENPFTMSFSYLYGNATSENIGLFFEVENATMDISTAENYYGVTRYSQDYEDATTYANGWSSTRGWSQKDMDGNKVFYISYNANNNNTDYTLSFANNTYFENTDDYIFAFDYGFSYGNANAKASSLKVKDLSGNVIFSFDNGGNYDRTCDLTYGSTTVEDVYRAPYNSFTAPFATFTITGNAADGLILSISGSTKTITTNKKTEDCGAISPVYNVRIGDFARIGSIVLTATGGAAHFGFDNMILKEHASGAVAEDPSFAFNKVSDENRVYTITNPNGEGTLYYTTATAAEAPAVGDAAYSSTTEASIDVPFGTGTYYAYAVLADGTTTSAVISQEVTGGAIQLVKPYYNIVSYDANTANTTVTLNTNVSGLLGTPTATIKYTIGEGEEQSTTNGGTVLVADGSTITFYAKAEGYTTSESVTVTAAAPNRNPQLWTENYKGKVSSDKGFTLGTDVVATENNTNYYYLYYDETTQLSENLLANGVYSNNMIRSNGYYSGQNASLAIYNLKKGDYVTFTGAYGNGAFSISENSSDFEADAWHTINGSQYCYTVKRDCSARFTLGRYGYLQSITVQRVPASATITSAGWATLYTDQALDFSSVEGLEAYTATLSDNTVTLTKVDNIPANTGVVLKAAETLSENKTYSIPVAISSTTTDKGSLKGSTTEAKEASEQSPIYILKMNNNNEAQFMRATSGSLAAGKAYLEIANGVQEAKALTVVFANDPTGIASVNAAETVQPVKRIVNGQLVIEKNGKRYNAAGAEF